MAGIPQLPGDDLHDLRGDRRGRPAAEDRVLCRLRGGGGDRRRRVQQGLVLDLLRAGHRLGFFAIWKANSIFGFLLPYFSFLPFFESWWYAYLFIAIVAIGSLVLLVLAWLRERNTAGGANLRSLHLKMPVRSVLKTLLLAAVLLAFAYLTLMVIVYLFDQDYRLWMAVFTEMKVEYWRYIWRLFWCSCPAAWPSAR